MHIQGLAHRITLFPAQTYCIRIHKCLNQSSRGFVLAVLASVVFFQSLPDIGHRPFRVLHENLLAFLVVGETVDGAGRLGLELRVGLQQRPLFLRQHLGHVDLHVNVMVSGAVSGWLWDALALEKYPEGGEFV